MQCLSIFGCCSLILMINDDFLTHKHVTLNYISHHTHIYQDPHVVCSSPLEPQPTAAPSSTCFPCHINPELMAFVSAGLRRRPKDLKATSPAGGLTTCCWSMLPTEPPSWRTTWTPQILPTGSSSLELPSRYNNKPHVYMHYILHIDIIHEGVKALWIVI